MIAATDGLALTQAREITETSVLRIGPTDYPVASLYVTPSGARVLQLAGETTPRVFLADDIVTLVAPTPEGRAA